MPLFKGYRRFSFCKLLTCKKFSGIVFWCSVGANLTFALSPIGRRCKSAKVRRCAVKGAKVRRCAAKREGAKVKYKYWKWRLHKKRRHFDQTCLTTNKVNILSYDKIQMFLYLNHVIELRSENWFIFWNWQKFGRAHIL